MEQKRVLAALVKLVGDRFSCPVYADEVREKFTKPCFFIAFTTITTPVSVTTVGKRMTVFLTHFPKDTQRNELTYLEVFDALSTALGLGFKVGERFIHIDDISEERIGEQQDILQIKVQLSYTTITPPQTEGEPMEEVEVRYETKH